MQINDLDLFKVDISTLSDIELEQYIKDMSVLKFKPEPVVKSTSDKKSKSTKPKTNKEKQLENLVSSLDENDMAELLKLLGGK